MKQDWIEGANPKNKGVYWVTVHSGVKYAVQLLVFDTLDKQWHSPDRSYGTFLSDNIVAYMPAEATTSPYIPGKIGSDDHFYIKEISQSGEVSYYAKQHAYIEWSKIGYQTIEKAVDAARRSRKTNSQLYPESPRNYYVVDAYSNVVKIVAEDIE